MELDHIGLAPALALVDCHTEVDMRLECLVDSVVAAVV